MEKNTKTLSNTTTFAIDYQVKRHQSYWGGYFTIRIHDTWNITINSQILYPGPIWHLFLLAQYSKFHPRSPHLRDVLKRAKWFFIPHNGKTGRGNHRCSIYPGGHSIEWPTGGSSQGKINPFFFSVANTSNGSKIYPQTPNGSKWKDPAASLQRMFVFMLVPREWKQHPYLWFFLQKITPFLRVLAETPFQSSLSDTPGTY